TVVRQRSISFPQRHQPFAFLTDQLRILFRPGEAAIERANHHWSIHQGSERTSERRGDGGDAMNQIETMLMEVASQFSAELMLKNHVRRPGHRGVDGPRQLFAAAEELRQPIEGSR